MPRPKPPEVLWVRMTDAQAEEMDRCCSFQSSTGLLGSEFLAAVEQGNREEKLSSQIKLENQDPSTTSDLPPGLATFPRQSLRVLCISSEEEPLDENAEVRKKFGQSVLDAKLRKEQKLKKTRAATVRKNQKRPDNHARNWRKKLRDSPEQV